jgi:predicted metal-dependent HD superfamily phosphohydrolase
MDLAAAWRAAARAAAATAPDADLDGAGAALLARWSEPHRQYHTTTHLTDVLAVIDAHAAHAAHPERVRLAAWWHDAIYDPRAGGTANERASASLAREVLDDLGVPAAAVSEVARLVLLTAGHTAEPADRDGALLCDADLAVLARPAPGYDAYAAAVRREYAHVPLPLFRAGRAAVLRRLLELPQLYRLAPLRAAWEPAARANLRRELTALSGGAGSRA